MDIESEKPPSDTLDERRDDLSPSSDAAAAELFSSPLTEEAKDTTIEVPGEDVDDDDDLLLNCSPINVFPSSHWSQPWPGNNDFGDDESERKSVEVEADAEPTLWSWTFQDSKPAIVGAGLANLGNTCFLNSVLQCFIHTVPLLHGIISDTHSAQFNCNKEEFCMLCAMRELVELSLTTTNSIVSPWSFVNNLNYFSSSFQRFQQEDAHEFLQCFLDRLESCQYAKRKDSVCSQSDNIVKQVFGGRLVSKLKCCNCGHCSDTYEPSIDLSLEIEDADNLITALQSFTKVEKIEDPETKFTCENCKEQVSVEKQLAFDQAPSVAAFHLKRFKNDGCWVQKIDKHVAFPLGLDLLPFTGSDRMNNGDLKYELYAIVVHIGLTSTSGHYYCFIRLSPGIWCKFDDSKVGLVEEDYVLSQEAYILFYAKEGTPWFSSFIETQKCCVDSTIWNTSPKSVLDNVEPSLTSPVLQNRISSDISEACHTIESEPEGADNNEIEDSGAGYGKSQCNGSREWDGMPISVLPDASNSLGVSLPEAQKANSPSVLGKVDLSQDAAVRTRLNIVTPQTPPRSPSPEIYREDPPDAGFSIPRDHLKRIDRVSCKRRLEKDMDDLETKQARSFIKKSIPGSRGQQLLAAIRGSKSESSVNKKKSRKVGLPLSPLVAGTYR